MSQLSNAPALPAGPRFAKHLQVPAFVGAIGAERLLIVGLVAACFVAHSLNMFHYPSFTLIEEEGLVAADGWAMLREQDLSPYTFVYERPPAGPLILAAWSQLSGGLELYGGAINSGRIFMLLLHLMMVPLLYQITRKLGADIPGAGLAALLFSVSPLAVFYYRVLLLDTVLLFLLLLSFDLLLDGWGRLSRVILSGCFFGLAVLTRETALIFLPAFLFVAFHNGWKHQGNFAFSGWTGSALMVFSLYPAAAFLKGELLPDGAQSPESAVSLIGALWSQAIQGGGGVFSLDNQFWGFLRADWLRRDALLLGGGALAILANLVRGLRPRHLQQRLAFLAGLMGLLPLFYLARGGLVLRSDVLLAIPFLAINAGLLLTLVFSRIPRSAAVSAGAVMGSLLLAFYWQTGQLSALFEEHPDDAGREAVAWVKANLPPESRIITRNDVFTALRERSADGPAFPNAHTHWKLAGDPEIRTEVFQDDWRRIDYLLVAEGSEEDFAASGNAIALEAMRNAHIVKRWEIERGNERFHPHQWLELWRVDSAGITEGFLLSGGSAYLNSQFNRQGAYVDAEGNVTAEAQGYALLRAVWSDDRAAFNEAWNWTRQNLLQDDGQLAWQWRNGRVVDGNSSTHANVDTALALLMAGRQWQAPELIAEGERLVKAIWRYDVVSVNGVPYITAGDWASSRSTIAVNPGYFAPYAYRVFEEVDPQHAWMTLIDSGYELLDASSSSFLGKPASAGLPPDWIGLTANGKVTPLVLAGNDTTSYGPDAARLYWRLALDWKWNGDGRAQALLTQAGFLADEVQRKGYVSGVYSHDGLVIQEPPTLIANAGALAALLTLEPPAASALYASEILGQASSSEGMTHWRNPMSLHDQEWGWFSTALYADVLRDVWRKR